MIRTTATGNTYWLAVVSSGRPQNIAPLTDLIGPATWYVAPAEFGTYLDTLPLGGLTRDGQCVQIATGGALCVSRNTALRAAWAAGQPCVMCDDDLKKFTLITPSGPIATSLDKVVDIAYAERDINPFYHLVGVAPTENAYFYNPARPVGNSHFCGGWLTITWPCDLFYDEALLLKEDYDYTIAHIVKYGGVTRLNSVIVAHEQRTNKGGVVVYRTPERERAAIAHIRAKWPGLSRDNGRRADEIVLRSGGVLR